MQQSLPPPSPSTPSESSLRSSRWGRGAPLRPRGRRLRRGEGVVCLLVNGVRWTLDLLGRGMLG